MKFLNVIAFTAIEVLRNLAYFSEYVIEHVRVCVCVCLHVYESMPHMGTCILHDLLMHLPKHGPHAHADHVKRQNNRSFDHLLQCTVTKHSWAKCCAEQILLYFHKHLAPLELAAFLLLSLTLTSSPRSLCNLLHIWQRMFGWYATSMPSMEDASAKGSHFSVNKTGLTVTLSRYNAAKLMGQISGRARRTNGALPM